MKFIDEVTIDVLAGDGGNGCVSFRREKFVPRGGPNGGDGGDGGSVIFLGDKNMRTLLEMKVQKTYKAERGQHGMGKNLYGKKGERRIIRLPLGTVIYNDDTGVILGDILEHGQEIIAARGGKGGRGNAHFATSTHQAPREFEHGGKGDKRRLRLELKLMADVGLVGLPNAGKSTLLRKISRARPKVAAYPFTTLVPNLGVVSYGDYSSFVMADLPGLIEGASQGAGLGHQFLRHIERTRVLLFLLDASGTSWPDAYSAYRILRTEIEKHNPELLQREAIVALNKTDMIHDKSAGESQREKFQREGVSVMLISALKGQGLKELIHDLGHKIDQVRQDQEPASSGSIQ